MYTNNDITSSLHTYLFLRSIPERCILEALLRRVLYCGHSTQYIHLVSVALPEGPWRLLVSRQVSAAQNAVAMETARRRYNELIIRMENGRGELSLVSKRATVV